MADASGRKEGAPKVAFVCIQNAGRSQMATAFAERALAERDLEVELVMGGTDPAASVHDNVVEVMAEVGIDVSDRRPRVITKRELADADVVVGMGCSAEGVCPATWRNDARDWDLPDPDEGGLDAAREIRDEVERRVHALLDELAASEVPPGERAGG